MTWADSYRNPFADYNANVMSSSQILDYWCSPHNFGPSLCSSENTVLSEPMPIIFMGGRGTGKTMFLKYFSYNVQRDQAIRYNKDLLSHLRERGGVGFYFRFDGPLLRSFSGKRIDDATWNLLFAHYFELQVCRGYLEVLFDLRQLGAISEASIQSAFVPQMASILAVQGEGLVLSDLINHVKAELVQITNYRANVAFTTSEFSPARVFGSQDLTFGVPDTLREHATELKDLNFAILLDEYENFSQQQQRLVNSLVKFAHPGITFRLGMRLEGFHTWDTISENEYIKEGRDYHKFVFENFLVKDKKYRDFLLDVARKRLESVSFFKDRNLTDISQILGDKEGLEQEAIGLVGNRKNHFSILGAEGINLAQEELKGLMCNNPLLEMLNILWVLRGKKPEYVSKIMNDYLNNIKTPDCNKYSRDYVDKYKLSLMFLLVSYYKSRKMYYSFNTFCFLSSGIVGTFLELCRKSFECAAFQSEEFILNPRSITPKAQTEAALEYATSELDGIRRIPEHGNQLFTLAMNLGNAFRLYHRDLYLRYPETNQFYIDQASISDEITGKVFRSALRWSIIQKKSVLQQSSPGAQRGEVYTLNRVYAPAFGISYRTRGGYSHSAGDIDRLFKEIVQHELKSRKPKRHLGSQKSLDFGSKGDWIE